MQLQDIKKGSVVKVWTGLKGHDYVVVGEDTVNRRLLLIKNNCLNQDGTLHGATKHFHIKLPYTIIGGQKIVSGITRLLGFKAINSYSFERLLEDNPNYQILPALRTFKTSVPNNNLIATLY